MIQFTRKSRLFQDSFIVTARYGTVRFGEIEARNLVSEFIQILAPK